MLNTIAHIQERIRSAARACSRDPEMIRLVAVSKTVPAERIRPAIAAGVRILGENYIQEAGEKIEALADQPVSWHFIGHLQSNKAKFAVRWFDLIHTVDSLKLAREIDKQAAKLGKVQDVLVQVNVGGEASKAGLSPEETEALLHSLGRLGNLSVKGLMTIPPYFDAPDTVRPYFRELAELREHLAEKAIAGIHLEELSMGMTGDFEAAIAEGATLVRIGSAIFGERS
ncbi:MAG: YggS family pyridoxal phosphate-dependent enzyme [Thermodesulfobacteriota bacterium]